MLGLLFVIVSLVLGLLLFGITDDRRSVLNAVGLDFKKEKYEELKYREHAKAVKRVKKELEERAKQHYTFEKRIELLKYMLQLHVDREYGPPMNDIDFDVYDEINKEICRLSKQ